MCVSTHLHTTLLKYITFSIYVHRRLTETTGTLSLPQTNKVKECNKRKRKDEIRMESKDGKENTPEKQRKEG